MARRTSTADPTDCCPSVTTAPLAEGDAAELAKGYAALGDPIRLRLLSMLAAADGEVCACAFVETLDRSQPTISHHLRVLADAGLIVGDRRGRWVWYRVIPAQLERLSTALSSASPALT